MADLTQAMLKELQSMIKVNNEEGEESRFIETGNIGFDMAISNGKGIPLGCSILFWGSQGCGKTTLFADVARRLIEKGKKNNEPFKVLYIDVEGSEFLTLDSRLGLKKYYHSCDFLRTDGKDHETGEIHPITWSLIESMYDAILAEKPGFKDIKLVIIDSINNVLSAQQEKNSITSGDFGTRAKERSNFWAKYLPQCKQKKVSTFMISQARTKQDAVLSPYVSKEKPAGSFADFHNADVILKCIKASASSHDDSAKKVTLTAYNETKDQDRFILVLDPTAEGSKNRIARTYKCEVLIEKGFGAHNFYSLRKILEFHGFLKKNGAWYQFAKELIKGFNLPDKKMNREEVNKILRQNEELFVKFLKETDCYSIVSKTEDIAESDIDMTEDIDTLNTVDNDMCNDDNDEDDEE